VQQSRAATLQGQEQHPQPRRRKSGSWFRRKSAIFFMEGDSDIVEETQQEQHKHIRTDTPLKISAPIYEPPAPAPSLPHINALRGGSLTDGAFASDDVFTGIGR